MSSAGDASASGSYSLPGWSTSTPSRDHSSLVLHSDLAIRLPVKAWTWMHYLVGRAFGATVGAAASPDAEPLADFTIVAGSAARTMPSASRMCAIAITHAPLREAGNIGPDRAPVRRRFDQLPGQFDKPYRKCARRFVRHVRR